MNPTLLLLAAWASWYGPEHQGRLTASGERFDCRALTCAYWNYPIGAVLVVTRNGHAVRVRVNDRGPAKWTGRQIDLSLAAAERLGMVKRGVEKVKIQRIK